MEPRALYGKCKMCGESSTLYISKKDYALRCQTCYLTEEAKIGKRRDVIVLRADVTNWWVVVCTRCTSKYDWRFRHEEAARSFRNEHERTHKTKGYGFISNAMGVTSSHVERRPRPEAKE